MRETMAHNHLCDDALELSRTHRRDPFDFIEEPGSPEFEQHIATKFGVDLGGAIKRIIVGKFSGPSDGHIHSDHWNKIITLLVYFSPTCAAQLEITCKSSLVSEQSLKPG